MAYIGAEPLPGQNREVDDISSSFNGSTTAFTLQVNGLNVSPETANNILVNIGGVIQNPGTDYTIAASTITFTTAPASGLSFFAIILGAGINTATVADQTIGTSKILDNAVTADKLAHTSVTAGSYTTADITVDAQGRITAAASGTIANAEIADGAITNAKVNNSAAIDVSKLSGVMPLAGGTFTGDVTFDGQTAGRDIIFDRSDNSLGFADNTKIRIGNSQDLEIYHSGSQSLITHGGNGQLIIQGNDNDQVKIMKGSSEEGIILNNNGDVELYHNNVLRFETFTEGAHVHVAGNSGLRIIGTTADVDPRIVFRRKNNDANNSEPAAIQMTYHAGTTHESGHLDFFTNGDSGSAALSKRMRISNDGTIFLSSNTNPIGGGSGTLYVAGSQMQVFRGNQGDYIVFKTTSNSIVGTIRNNGNTSTQYNTSSDYRLKENQTAISDGITRLKTLKPYRFNWKSDSSRTVDGFFAHEVTAVPEAISGTKDAIAVQEDVDEGRATNVGDPVYQSIDHSKLVPLLTAALQEAIAKIETLETKVAALEAA